MKYLILASIFALVSCGGGGGGGKKRSGNTINEVTYNFTTTSPGDFVDDENITLPISSDNFAYETLSLFEEDTCDTEISNHPSATVLSGLNLTIPTNASYSLYGIFKNIGNQAGVNTGCLELLSITHDDIAPSDPVSVPTGIDSLDAVLTNTLPVTITISETDFPADTDIIKLYSDPAGTVLIEEISRDDVASGDFDVSLPTNQQTDVYVRNADFAGNESNVFDPSISITHDDVAPVTSITSTSRIQPNTNITGNCENDVTFTGDLSFIAVCGGGTFSYNPGALPDGDVDYTITSTDAAGNETSLSATTTIDGTAPSSSVVNTALTGAGVRVGGTTYNFDEDDFTVDSDTQLVRLCSNSACGGITSFVTYSTFQSSGIDVTLTADTSNDIYFQLTDTAGNVSSPIGPYTVESDTTAPANPTLDAALANYASTYTSANTITFTGSVDANTVTVEVYDQSDMSTVLQSFTKVQFESGTAQLNLVQDSSVTYAVVAVNDLSNDSVTPQTFTVNHVGTPVFDRSVDVASFDLGEFDTLSKMPLTIQSTTQVPSKTFSDSVSLSINTEETTYNINEPGVLSLVSSSSNISNVTSTCFGTSVDHNDNCTINFDIDVTDGGEFEENFVVAIGSDNITIDVDYTGYDYTIDFDLWSSGTETSGLIENLQQTIAGYNTTTGELCSGADLDTCVTDAGLNTYISNNYSAANDFSFNTGIEYYASLDLVILTNSDIRFYHIPSGRNIDFGSSTSHANYNSVNDKIYVPINGAGMYVFSSDLSSGSSLLNTEDDIHFADLGSGTDVVFGSGTNLEVYNTGTDASNTTTIFNSSINITTVTGTPGTYNSSNLTFDNIFNYNNEMYAVVESVDNTSSGNDEVYLLKYDSSLDQLEYVTTLCSDSSPLEVSLSYSANSYLFYNCSGQTNFYRYDITLDSMETITTSESSTSFSLRSSSFNSIVIGSNASPYSILHINKTTGEYGSFDSSGAPNAINFSQVRINPSRGLTSLALRESSDNKYRYFKIYDEVTDTVTSYTPVTGETGEFVAPLSPPHKSTSGKYYQILLDNTSGLKSTLIQLDPVSGEWQTARVMNTGINAEFVQTAISPSLGDRIPIYGKYLTASPTFDVRATIDVKKFAEQFEAMNP